MGYKPRNTGKSIRRAASKRSVVDDALDSAMNSLRNFGETTKRIQKTDKLMDEISGINQMQSYFRQQDKLDQSDYKALESTFNKALKNKQKTDPNIKYSFPTYKEYKKGEFSPYIGDMDYNETALDYMQAGVGEDILEVILKGMK